MDDIAEGFRILKENAKQKRHQNTKASTAILHDRGIKFISQNNGSHLIVHSKNEKKVIDFWPSTGRYIVRNGRSGRGVFNLINEVNRK